MGCEQLATFAQTLFSGLTNARGTLARTTAGLHSSILKFLLCLSPGFPGRTAAELPQRPRGHTCGRLLTFGMYSYGHNLQLSPWSMCLSIRVLVRRGHSDSRESSTEAKFLWQYGGKHRVNHGCTLQTGSTACAIFRRAMAPLSANVSNVPYMPLELAVARPDPVCRIKLHPVRRTVAIIGNRGLVWQRIPDYGPSLSFPMHCQTASARVDWR